MAIIKKLKRLGATVRGAIAGRVCSFDKDGNVISTAKYVNDLPGHPAAGDAGKVWTATGAGAASWQDVPDELPQHGAQDEGKVLAIDDTGSPVWATVYTAVEVPISDITFEDGNGDPVEAVLGTNTHIIRIGNLGIFSGRIQFPADSPASIYMKIAGVSATANMRYPMINFATTDFYSSYYSGSDKTFGINRGTSEFMAVSFVFSWS